MTREAKIGMLTGLGVIILIGVLLSEYLGDARGWPLTNVSGPGMTTIASGDPTGRMAELPIGATYRRQVMEPVTVPTPNDLPVTESPSGGGAISLPILAAGVPAAYAAENLPASESSIADGPSISKPASPIQVGPAPRRTVSPTDGPPIITVAALEKPVADTPESVSSRDAAKPSIATKTYEIAPGDSLAKIARKFYNSSKMSDVNRIVAANHPTLKDADTVLVAGKKLTIPVIAPSKPAAPADPSPATLKMSDTVLVYLPGSSEKATAVKSEAKTSTPSRPTTPAKKQSAPAKIYKVQPNDTLAAIARKFAPSHSADMLEKLKTANAIKDPTTLKPGQQLKIPA